MNRRIKVLQTFALDHLATSPNYKKIYNKWIYRAGDGTRTRDINLGKVALYQLSYARFNGLDDGPKNQPGRA